MLYPGLHGGDGHRGDGLTEGIAMNTDAPHDTESLLWGPGGHFARSSAAAQDSVADLHRVLGTVGLEAFRAFLPPMDSSTGGSAPVYGRTPAPFSRQRTSRDVSLSSGLLPRQFTGTGQSRNTRMFASHDTSMSTSAGCAGSAGEEVRDWASTVSQGEKQRIAVARALLRRPQLVRTLASDPFFAFVFAGGLCVVDKYSVVPNNDTGAIRRDQQCAGRGD